MMHLFTKLIYCIQGGHCETSSYCFHIAVIKGVHACVGFVHGCVGFVHGWPFIYSISFLTVELLLWVIPFLTDFQISSNQYWFSYQRTQSGKLFISVSLKYCQNGIYNHPSDIKQPPSQQEFFIYFFQNEQNKHTQNQTPTKLRLHMVTFTFLWGWCQSLFGPNINYHMRICVMKRKSTSTYVQVM